MKLRVSIALLLLTAATSFAKDVQIPAQNARSQQPKLWFPVGEELLYVVKWGFIPVAKTRVVSRWVEYKGRTLLSIRYRTRSNRAIARIYPVNDLIEALVDPHTFRPVRFVKKLREGRHNRFEVTYFDYESGIARWYAPEERKIGMYAIDEDTRDLVSFMFYLRKTPFHPNQTSTHRLMADNKLYELSLNTKEHDSVKLSKYGKVRSLRMEPIAKFQGLFVRKGKLDIWVSDDSRRVITKIRAEVPVADIRILLCGVGGPGNDEWTNGQFSEVRACDDDPDVDRALKELDEDISITDYEEFIW